MSTAVTISPHARYATFAVIEMHESLKDGCVSGESDGFATSLSKTSSSNKHRALLQWVLLGPGVRGIDNVYYIISISKGIAWVQPSESKDVSR
jgi:hypothetical protein